MSYTSHVQVNLDLLVTIETDSPPGNISDVSLKGILTDVVADQLSQYSNTDITAAIAGFKVIDVTDDLTEEEKWPLEDWQYDVSNGDTKLGYTDWVKHQKESERG